MIYWYEQLLYGFMIFAIIEFGKYYFLDGEDLLLRFIKYWRKK